MILSDVAKNYHNVLLVSSKIELAFLPCMFMFCHEKNMFTSKQRLDSNIVWNYTDDGDHIQFGIFLKQQVSRLFSAIVNMFL